MPFRSGASERCDGLGRMQPVLNHGSIHEPVANHPRMRAVWIHKRKLGKAREAAQGKAMQDSTTRRGLSPIYLDEAVAEELPAILPRHGRKKIIFGWYGGKFS